MKKKIDLPVFMGVCESALVRGDGVLQDFYGVGDLLLLPFFPQNLKGIFLLIGLPGTIIDEKKPVSYVIRDKKNPKNKAFLTIEVIYTELATGKARISGFSKHYTQAKTEKTNHISNGAMGTRLIIPQKTFYKLLPIPCPPLFVKEPVVIDVLAKMDGRESQIGSFECRFCPTHQISEEERMAMMSRPGAIKGIVFGISCKKCHDKVHFHLSLDGSTKPPRNLKESISLTTASDEWNCKCGKMKIPLIYLKQGFHDMFRRIGSVGGEKELEFVPLYQRGAIAAITSQYQKMLYEYRDSEEAIQKFMELNPIIWNFLAPKKIWKKPPVSTKYKADFAILTRLNILYFVEIEKPITKLVKSRGGISAELQIGLDQIGEWRIEVEKRREAILDGLGLTQKDVHDIRYILVAGMASNTTTEGLEKIRKMTAANFIFCFDELVSFMHSTETVLLNI